MSPCPPIKEAAQTEEEKREHVIKLNLARRHLEPYQWGEAFKLLLEAPLKAAIKKAVEEGTPPKEAAKQTICEKAAEVGVPVETARKRLRAADAFAALPAKEKAAIVASALAGSPDAIQRTQPPDVSNHHRGPIVDSDARGGGVETPSR